MTSSSAGHDAAGSEPALLGRLLRVLTVLAIPAVLIVMVLGVEFLKDEDVPKIVQVLVAVLLGAAGVWALFWAMDRTVNLFPRHIGARLRPYVFVGPAIFMLTFFLVYPALNTAIISFFDESGANFVGLENYVTLLTKERYLIAIRNSIGWVVIVPALSVGIGLGYATLVDKLRARYEAIAKSLIFLPMAISFVGASVVWGFVYAFRPEGFGEQIGLLNGIWVALGNDPVNWLAQKPWNNGMLMFILVWLQVGFSMVILSSAIKGVPDDILEAAEIDGASEWQSFRRITVPTISSTIVVVWTTVVITTWKIFDIVFVMTGGRDDTQVVAQQMVLEFFTFFNDGIGAALAVILFIAVIPILVVNIRRFQAQEQIR